MPYRLLLGLLSVLVFIGFGESLSAQTSGTLKGYVRDVRDGETLIGATVQLAGQGVGTVTNEYGFYSLTLPSGSYEIVVGYLGYADERRNVELTLGGDRKF